MGRKLYARAVAGAGSEGIMKLPVWRNESGFCLCGCGQQTKVATRGNKRLGVVIGEPLRYLPGHYAKRFYPKNWEDYPPPVRDAVSGCLRWQGPHDKNGYGRFGKWGRKQAHREAWLRSGKEIPKGLVIDHVLNNGCVHRDCVELTHLEPVTIAENFRRAPTEIERRNRTHCPKGHPYSGENLVVNRKGRACRECGRAASRGWARREALRRFGKGDWFCLSATI